MISNPDIAALLDELADLLEIKGSNPFRIRAYRNAVRTVEGLTRPLARMVEEGEDLTALPAIGKDLAGHLTTIVETGRFPLLEEVATEVPRSLTVLVKLDGVGPKKAAKLHAELGIETVDALEEAIQAGSVERLAGFGKKSAEKILRSIADLRSHQARFQLSDVETLIEGVRAHAEAAPGVARLEVAGSFRRRRETVGDVDLLVELAPDGDGAAVVEHFTRFPGAVRVEAAGGTKGTVVLRSGLQVDLRVIPPESWGAALHYFTGSKEHNVRVRQLAQRQGLRVNEWGVYRVPEEAGDAVHGGGSGAGGVAAGDAGAVPADAGGAAHENAVGDPAATAAEKAAGAPAAEGGSGAAPAALDPSWVRVAGGTEASVFEILGLPWIPPEIRENRGEIEAGLEGRIPRLLELEDLKGDLQMHSTWSDGKNSIEEMVLACRERGYEYLAVTDHSPALAMIEGLTPEKARRQWEEVESVRARVDGIELFRSCEVDILRDGSLDMPDEILAELDLVVVSVHSFMDLDEAAMTDRVLKAIAHPEVDILAHPTGRIINRRTPFALDVESVLQAALELDVAVELNADPNRLDLSDVHVRRAKELGVKVAVSTDAHSVRGLGMMRYGVGQARRGWLGPDDVLNCLPLDDFRAWLRRRGS